MQLLCFLVLSVLACSAFAGKLPEGFKVCKRDDPELKQCLKVAIEETLVKFKDGNEKLGAGTIEPLFIPEATIGEGKGVVNFVQNYKNFKLYNIASTKVDVTELVFTDKSFQLSIDIAAPEYRVDSDYEFNGRVLLLPIVGKGKCGWRFVNATGTLNVTTDVVEKKGKEYLTVKSCTLKLNADKLVMNFENLFNGDETLGKEMNNLLNDNWKDVFADVGPGYEKVIASALQNYIDNFFSRVPYAELVLAS